MELVLIDVWGYRGYLVPEHYAGRRSAGPTSGSGPSRAPTRTRTRSMGCTASSTSIRWSCWRSRTRSSVERPPGVDGRVRAAPRARPEPARGSAGRSRSRRPAGVSFTLDGHALSWQNWTLRLGFNHREGLVLHTLGFAGRSIAHRISVAEMVVPYRDPSPDHYRRTAYDVGEWGLGFMTQSLELGCDCLGEIRYVDAVLHDTAGEPYVIKNAICIHEEDDGVLWKHVDHMRGRGGPPLAAAGDIRPRHRRQLRVPRLLAPVPGRLDRVPRARDGDHGRRASPRRRSGACTGRWSISGRTRRFTSTF